MAVDPNGKLADNIVYFARALRKAGLRVGPGSVADAVSAVLAAGISSREDFYWTLHAVLVNRHEDHVVFDSAFHMFWKSRGLVEKLLAMLSPVAPATKEKEKPAAGEKRASDALMGQEENDRSKWEEIEIDARFSLSANEVLRSRDFAQMSADEIIAAQRAMAELVMPRDMVKTRRFRTDPRGSRIDPRAMMRTGLRTGGDIILPRFRSTREIHPPLVILADISGSMSQYSRIFLHFLHALAEKRRRVHSFVFGTRLTNLTRQLRHRDPDEALADCAAAVQDWSGGTRIGEAIGTFNRLWSRRVLGQGAVVLLITDGLERDDIETLSREMERLHKSCRRLVWLNPLLRYSEFQPRARGMQAMLPHVDELRPVHSLNSLADLCSALGQDAPRQRTVMQPKGLAVAHGRHHIEP